MRRPTRGAFTLIELLVVVAILAILIGILLPALSRARAAAITLGCLSNIRMLATAQHLYANDHDGRLVHYGLSHGGTLSRPEVAWINSLQPYYDQPLVARSPVDQSLHWPDEDDGAGVPVPGAPSEQYRVTSYGINDFVTPATPITGRPGQKHIVYDRMTRIPAPHATVQFLMMAFEGPFAGSDHVHPLGWGGGRRGGPDIAIASASNEMEINAHGGADLSWDGRSNYAFLDGHATTSEFREIFEDLDHNQFDPYVAR